MSPWYTILVIMAVLIVSVYVVALKKVTDEYMKVYLFFSVRFNTWQSFDDVLLGTGVTPNFAVPFLQILIEEKQVITRFTESHYASLYKQATEELVDETPPLKDSEIKRRGKIPLRVLKTLYQQRQLPAITIT